MKFEKLSKENNGNKKFLYGFITCAILLIIFNLFMSYAKYKSVDSVKLASGTISYSRADFSLLGIKIQEKEEDGSGKINEGNQVYKDTEQIPGEEYIFNEKNTYCTIGNSNVHYTGKDELQQQGILITYDSTNGFIFSGIKKTNTKCYVYFDVIEKGSSDKTLANLNLKSKGIASGFGGTACETGCKITDENGVYEADDDYGTSYYFRGTVDNNWVKFGQTTSGTALYWRIIRINGNGTIRLIYAGEEESFGNGNGKNAVNSKTYNSSFNDNKDIGFMYGKENYPTTSYENAHKNENKSGILTALYNWWNTTNLESLLKKIDGATGFCNDRESYNGSSSSSKPNTSSYGYGKITTFYGPYIRAWQTNRPTFKCAQKYQDLFTLKGEAGDGNGALEKPVGLITSDEVIYAGGYRETNNTNYWLYTNEYYWTMSPANFNSNANGYVVGGNGNLYSSFINNNNPGIRPIINLNYDLKFTGNGKKSTPFEVSS